MCGTQCVCVVGGRGQRVRWEGLWFNCCYMSQPVGLATGRLARAACIACLPGCCQLHMAALVGRVCGGVSIMQAVGCAAQSMGGSNSNSHAREWPRHSCVKPQQQCAQTRVGARACAVRVCCARVQCVYAGRGSVPHKCCLKSNTDGKAGSLNQRPESLVH